MKYFNLIENEFGYILENGITKYVLYRSKHSTGGNYAPYYLKQVAPYSNYISGMYIDKDRQNKFNGKFNNYTVVIILFEENQSASVFFNDRNKVATQKHTQRKLKQREF